VAAVGARAGAGDGGDDAGRFDHLADAMVVGIGDVDVAAAIDGHPGGVVQHGGGRGTAVAGVAGDTVTGDGDDLAGRFDHLADAAVGRIGDVDVAGAIHGDVRRPRQLGGGRDLAVAVVAGGAVAGQGDDAAGRCDDRGNGVGAADAGAGGVLDGQLDVVERAG